MVLAGVLEIETGVRSASFVSDIYKDSERVSAFFDSQNSETLEKTDPTESKVSMLAPTSFTMSATNKFIQNTSGYFFTPNLPFFKERLKDWPDATSDSRFAVWNMRPTLETESLNDYTAVLIGH